uniref:Immature colon carcinoma transcript 1 n=1 Tax=Nothobranchius furzeri TaxID=105023 RepID=A0A8C6PPK5_NOTFU
MAACIGRHSYLLCCAGGLNVRLPHNAHTVLRKSQIPNSTFLNDSFHFQSHHSVFCFMEINVINERISTKAEVRFHVHTADWIPHDVRQKILEKNKNRINKAGELLVTSETSRSQQRNLSDCIQKISSIIAEASEKPREATAEESAVRAARLEKRNKERLKEKRIHSATKHSRHVEFD